MGFCAKPMMASADVLYIVLYYGDIAFSLQALDISNATLAVVDHSVVHQFTTYNTHTDYCTCVHAG